MFSFPRHGNSVFKEPLWRKGALAWAPGAPPLQEGASSCLMPSTHLPPLSGGDPVVWAVNLRTLNRASFQGFADSPLLPPPSLTAGASLGTSKAASSHHSNCPSHQWMEITFHDGSSDVAIFCVDQNNKTNQTLGV